MKRLYETPILIRFPVETADILTLSALEQGKAMILDLNDLQL